MSDREKWRERVRDIRASGTTWRWWWWWWWHIYIYMYIYIYIYIYIYVCIYILSSTDRLICCIKNLSYIYILIIRMLGTMHLYIKLYSTLYLFVPNLPSLARSDKVILKRSVYWFRFNFSFPPLISIPRLKRPPCSTIHQ